MGSNGPVILDIDIKWSKRCSLRPNG